MILSSADDRSSEARANSAAQYSSCGRKTANTVARALGVQEPASSERKRKEHQKEAKERASIVARQCIPEWSTSILRLLSIDLQCIVSVSAPTENVIVRSSRDRTAHLELLIVRPIT